MRLTCAIIDDEPLAVSLLESYVLKTPFLDLQGTYNSALDALSDLRDRPMDLLFLDHVMTEYMYMKKITAGIGRDLLYFHIPKQKSQLFLCFQGREYFKKCLDCSCYFSQLISS